MFARKGSLGLAVCAALAAAGYARGSGTAGSQLTPDQLQLSSPAYLDDTTAPAAAPAPPTPPQPLMYALEQVGVGKPLEDLRINLYGWLEGGYTYSGSAPPGNLITGNVFNTKHERIVLDQAVFNVERTVDKAASAKAGTFDIGFRGEFLYGWDAGAIHSNGLFDNPATLGVAPGNGYYRSRTSPENQFDVEQAYVDIAIPIGTGLQLRIGKFVTLLGQEVIDASTSTGAPANALYSHSYLFGYAIPFTHTGILGSYQLTEKLGITGGVTRGWNQSINDNNGAVDFLGQVNYTISDKTTLIVNASVGPQATKDNSDYWTVIDVIVTHKLSTELTVAVNGDYGDAPHAPGTGTAQWYGVAAYASLVLDPHFTLNARGEWYRDDHGFTLGTGVGMNVYEATVGVAITPFPENAIAKNFIIRPEVRFDYSDKKYFDAATDRYQFQAAVDAIFSF